MLRRFTTKKPESPTPVVVVPPDIAHPAALALQPAARGMTARRLRSELTEASKAARRHGFLLIVAERAYLWRCSSSLIHEALLRGAGSGALPADAARQCFGVLHELPRHARPPARGAPRARRRRGLARRRAPRRGALRLGRLPQAGEVVAHGEVRVPSARPASERRRHFARPASLSSIPSAAAARSASSRPARPSYYCP